MLLAEYAVPFCTSAADADYIYMPADKYVLQTRDTFVLTQAASEEKTPDYPVCTDYKDNRYLRLCEIGSIH